MFHRHRRDFSEFMLHHLVTIGLILFSYSLNFLECGAIIMIICDTTDIFVSLLKLVDILSTGYVFLPFYILMVVVWV